MFERTKYRGDTARSFAERQRRSAFLIGVAGLIINVSVYLLYAFSEGVTATMTFQVVVYAIVLAGITWSAVNNFHVIRVMSAGLVSIFFVFWACSLFEGWMGTTNAIDIPLVLFIPLFVSIILNYRILFLLAPVQAAFVYFMISEFAGPSLGAPWVSDNLAAFSMSFAGFSGISFVLLGVIASTRDRTDQQLYQVILEKQQLAETDDLTGILNRRAFMDNLKLLWPERSKICIAFVDLDHFKPLNDQFGHAVGDHVLREVAERIKSAPHVLSSARLGGDEFAVLFEEPESEAIVRSQIEHLHGNITRDLHWEGGVLPVGASIGYAEGLTMEQTLSGLLRAADTAMRRAKSGGADWAVFNPLIDNAAIASSTLEVELKSAITNGQIRAAVQPIVDAKSRETVAYELLARWVNSQFERDPSPSDFIPIAEKLGLLNEILWVTLDEALTNLDLSATKLAINVSPAQLLASDFIDCLVRILERNEVPPHAITIEITEQLAFRNVERNVAVLNQARDLGFEIALDDFGTGYSSLSMLDTLPLDKLKIDQSFVRKSRRSTQSKSILLAAIRLARQLGLESCVEGIETNQAARQIAALGADTMQGYLFGTPRLVQERSVPLKLVS